MLHQTAFRAPRVHFEIVRFCNPALPFCPFRPFCPFCQSAPKPCRQKKGPGRPFAGVSQPGPSTVKQARSRDGRSRHTPAITGLRSRLHHASLPSVVIWSCGPIPIPSRARCALDSIHGQLGLTCAAGFSAHGMPKLPLPHAGRQVDAEYVGIKGENAPKAPEPAWPRL